MKFSEMLGEPEPEPQLPAKDSEPISVFAPVPTTPPPAGANVEPPPPPPPPPPSAPLTSQVPPPMPGAVRGGLAELNVRQPVVEAPPEVSPLADQLVGLTDVVDDLLPSARRGRK